MSLAEVLPEVQSLSRLDKIRLIQLLAQELEQNDVGLIEPGRSYPIASPDRAFSAAAVLLQALEQDKSLGIDQLRMAQRILLVKEIWDSIVVEHGEIPLTEAQRQDLQRRIDAYEANPKAGSRWEEVKARLLENP